MQFPNSSILLITRRPERFAALKLACQALGANCNCLSPDDALPSAIQHVLFIDAESFEIAALAAVRQQQHKTPVLILGATNPTAWLMAGAHSCLETDTDWDSVLIYWLKINNR